jgi:hypothetical protein
VNSRRLYNYKQFAWCLPKNARIKINKQFLRVLEKKNQISADGTFKRERSSPKVDPVTVTKPRNSFAAVIGVVHKISGGHQAMSKKTTGEDANWIRHALYYSS